MATRRRKKISILGILAILLGATAWFSMRSAIMGVGAVVFGLAGALLGLLAMLGAGLLGSTGRLIPLIGFLACASAVGYDITQHIGVIGAVNQIRQFVARIEPASLPTQSAKLAAPTPVSSTVLPPTADGKPSGGSSIFDMASGGEPTPAAAAKTTVNASPAASAVVATPSPFNPTIPAPRLAQRYAAATTAVTKARAKLDAATASLIPALSETSEYQSAKTELDAASAALQAARAGGESASPQFVAADLRFVNAKTALRKVIEQAAGNDPQAMAAKQQLQDAQEALREATQDLDSAAGNRERR